jgi:peroxiredoxin Q/BCP
MSTLVVTNPDGTSDTMEFGRILSESPRTLLYFYPKDNTPGCTLEGQDFTRLLSEFAQKNIRVIGVSIDNPTSHQHFQDSCGIRLPLITDDGSLVTKFGVMGEKNMYGKMVFGLLRSTFLVNSNGDILQEWRNVRAK